jgi:hypothetical protein
MHSSTELRRSMFGIELEGRRVSLDEVLPGFDERDRLGIVVRERRRRRGERAPHPPR